MTGRFKPEWVAGLGRNMHSKAFDDLGVRKFSVSLGEKEEFKQLRVPSWMWNSYEWNSITQASGKTQRPLLEFLPGNRLRDSIQPYDFLWSLPRMPR